MRGYGYEPLFISIDARDDHVDAHQRFASVLDEALDRIDEIQRSARVDGVLEPADLADDRSPVTRRDGPAPRRSTVCRSRGRGARTRSR